MSSSTDSRLDQLVGLRSAKRVIRSLASRSSGVHAVLLYGPEGSGKSQLAAALAELWLCQNPGPEGADGECRACQAFSRGTSVDVLRIAPSGLSRIIPNSAITYDAQKKDEPQAPLVEFFRTPPMLSRHKVAIISDADRMNPAAFSALLKTLEEPYPFAKLILTTSTVRSMPATIQSRTLAVACELPSSEERSKLSSGLPDSAIRLSEGAPGRIARISEKPGPYVKLANFASGLADRSPGEALVAAEEFRAIADEFESVAGGARAGNTEALELLAIQLSGPELARPEWTRAVIEAHRRIRANGSFPIVADALFAEILEQRA